MKKKNPCELKKGGRKEGIHTPPLPSPLALLGFHCCPIELFFHSQRQPCHMPVGRQASGGKANRNAVRRGDVVQHFRKIFVYFLVSFFSRLVLLPTVRKIWQHCSRSLEGGSGEKRGGEEGIHRSPCLACRG